VAQRPLGFALQHCFPETGISMLSFYKNRLSDFTFSNRLLNFARNHVVSNSLTLTNPVTAGEH
jgi:hypothetical protein